MRVAFVAASATGAARAGDVRWVPAEHATIQGAVDASIDGDVVMVAPGTYAPFVIAGKGVTVASMGGPAAARIDAAGVAPCVIVTRPGAGAGAVLRGFTVAGGNGQNGGGVYAWGRVTVESCVIERCGAVNGGGVFLGGDAVIRGCTVRGNAALHGGGIALAPGSGGVIEACTIEDNAARLGGGVFAGPHAASYGSLVLRGCTVRRNRAIDGGGLATAGGSMLAEDASVVDNEAMAAGGGLLAIDGGGVSFARGGLVANAAPDGAAAYASAWGSISIVEAAVNANRAGPASAAVVAHQGFVEMIAADAWANTPADVMGPVVVSDGTPPPPPCELAWIAPPFDAFDVNDVLAFGEAFASSAAAADLALPLGVWNVDDLLEFVALLAACGEGP